MIKQFTASIWQEGNWFIAQCLEVDVASQGRTRAEAMENLKEALRLHFTPPLATITPELAAIEVDVHAAYTCPISCGQAETAQRRVHRGRAGG